MRVLKEAVYWFGIVYLLYLTVTVVSFFIFEHADFVGLFKSLYPDAYRAEEYGLTYFNEKHFQTVRTFGPAFVVVLLLLISALLLKRRRVRGLIDQCLNDISWLCLVIRNSFSNLSITSLVILVSCFVLLIAIKLTLYSSLPYQIDEAFNFLYFTDKGFWHTSIYANTHVLSNLVSRVWWNLGIDIELSSRLTSILSGVCIHILIFSVVTHFFSFRAGVFVLMLTGVTFWSNVYSVESGGYILMTVWVFVAAIGVCAPLASASIGNGLYIIGCVLGFYSSKLFILPFISLIILWICIGSYDGQFRKYIIQAFSSSFLAVAISALLYFPIYLWSGTDALFGTSTTSYDLISKSPVLLEGLSVMTEMNSKSYLIVILWLLLTGVAFWRGDGRVRLVIGLGVSTVVSILLFSVVFNVYAPSRALIYTNVLFYAVTGVIMAQFTLHNFQGRLALSILVLVVSLKAASSWYVSEYGWQNYYLGLQDQGTYSRLNDVTNQVMSYEPRLIYSDVRDTYLNVYLKLNAKRKGQTLLFSFDGSQQSLADVVVLEGVNVELKEGYRKLEDSEFGEVFVKAK